MVSRDYAQYENFRLKRENQTLKDEKHALETENATLRQQIAVPVKINTDLENRINQLTIDNNRLIKIVDELKSGYHLPEQWVAFRARMDIVVDVSKLYQVVYVLPKGGDTDYILNQIEILLSRAKCKFFGKLHEHMAFNPSTTSLANSASSTSSNLDNLVVRVPGVEAKDPVGNIAITARAIVIEEKNFNEKVYVY